MGKYIYDYKMPRYTGKAIDIFGGIIGSCLLLIGMCIFYKAARNEIMNGYPSFTTSPITSLLLLFLALVLLYCFFLSFLELSGIKSTPPLSIYIRCEEKDIFLREKYMYHIRKISIPLSAIKSVTEAFHTDEELFLLRQNRHYKKTIIHGKSIKSYESRKGIAFEYKNGQRIFIAFDDTENFIDAVKPFLQENNHAETKK